MNRLDYIIKKEGYWVYGIKKIPVHILEISVDYNLEYRKFEFEDTSNDQPRLNKEGKQYIITYGNISDLSDNPFFSECSLNFGGLTIQEALETSQELWNPIRWK